MSEEVPGEGGRRILVVDDSTGNLQLLSDLLTSAGYTVHPASDGELALRFVQIVLPDLIMLDIRMPGLDGFEVCRRLKADPRTASIPVIFISILEDERDKVEGFRAGGVDYVTKPFQPEEVIARVGVQLRLRELRQRLEDEIAEGKRVAEQLQEAVAELESFSYSTSHDLRAPLRAVHCFAELLLERHGESLPPEAIRYVEVIQNSAARMGLLIDSLLAFSRLGRKDVTKQTVQPERIIAPLLEPLRSQAAATRCVEVTVHPLPPCRADPVLLAQVFGNLLDNAFKYTRPRKVAVIEVGVLGSEDGEERDGEERDGEERDGEERDGEVVYYVRDNGIGFDPCYLDKLFGVFRRLHGVEDFEGVGIGLAIVQRIVRCHGGRVWAESQPGQGATFYVALEKAPVLVQR